MSGVCPATPPLQVPPRGVLPPPSDGVGAASLLASPIRWAASMDGKRSPASFRRRMRVAQASPGSMELSFWQRHACVASFVLARLNTPMLGCWLLAVLAVVGQHARAALRPGLHLCLFVFPCGLCLDSGAHHHAPRANRPRHSRRARLRWHRYKRVVRRFENGSVLLQSLANMVEEQVTGTHSRKPPHPFLSFISSSSSFFASPSWSLLRGLRASTRP